MEFAETSRKEYVAGMRLGVVTNTQDTSGEVLEERPVAVSRVDVEAALSRFRGDILQVPPMYSAVKIGGKKLYELARKGQEVERKPRPVTIYELELLEQIHARDFLLRCVCSKGTYIRTLCHDLDRPWAAAEPCSPCAARWRLVFLWSRPSLWMPSSLKGTPCCFPQTVCLPPIPFCCFLRNRRRNGSAAATPSSLPGTPDGTYRIYGHSRDFLCLSRAEKGTLTSIKNFFGA